VTVLRRDLLKFGLSRETWGWNEAGTLWVPPNWGGAHVDVDIFDGYAPIPPAKALARTAARHINACASRGGGKTYNTARVAAERMFEDGIRIMRQGDAVFSQSEWEPWFLRVVGRPGKPKLLRAEALKRIKNPCHYWVVAPDYELADAQAREQDAIWCQAWGDELGARLFGRTLWVFLLGIRIDFRTGEKPKKLVAASLNGIVFEEAARLKPEVFDNAEPAVDRRNGWTISNTTPDGKNGYWEKRWARGDKDAAIEAGHPDRYDPPRRDPRVSERSKLKPWRRWVEGCRNVHWTAEQNTALPHLAEEMARARRRMGARSLAYLQNWAASFDSPTGAIWPLLSRVFHRRDVDESRFLERVAAFDPGYGRTGQAAAALGMFGRLRDGRWHLYRGLLAQGVLSSPPMGKPVSDTPTWLGIAMMEAERCSKRFGQSITWYIDPSAPDDIAKWQASGLDARVANNHVRGGIATVEQLVSYDPEANDCVENEPWLTFARSLQEEFWRQLIRYRWAQDAQGRNLPWPHKEHDHACDVVRYAMHSVGAAVTYGGGGQPDEWDPVGRTF
jgi:hypothetical protein